MEPKHERRMLGLPTARIELRVADDGTKQIRGYAAVYYDGTKGTEYRLWRGMVERIALGAFDDVIGDDVRALFNHDSNMVLGRTVSKTARIFADSIGLGFEITPPESRADVVEAVERGDVTGSSFSFSVYGDGGKISYTTEGEIEVRTIEKVSDLFDVGPVTFPAFDKTTAFVRDVELPLSEYNAIQAERDKAKTLTRDQAKACARVIELDNETRRI